MLGVVPLRVRLFNMAHIIRVTLSNKRRLSKHPTFAVYEWARDSGVNQHKINISECWSWRDATDRIDTIAVSGLDQHEYVMLTLAMSDVYSIAHSYLP